MTLIEKINELDKFNDESFSVTRYLDWEFHPYKGPMSETTYDTTIRGKTFEEMIDNAYKKMIKIKEAIK